MTIDFLKPFRDLFHNAAQYIEQCFDDKDHKPRPAEPTVFESILEKCFNEHRGLPEYKAVRVMVADAATGGHIYRDPISGAERRGFYDIAPIASTKALGPMIKQYEDFGHRLVMLLDLHGGSLEEQIPGWKHGRIAFPDMFLLYPRITVDMDRENAPLYPSRSTNPESAMKPAIRLTKSGQHIPAPSHIRGVINNGP